MTNTIPHQSTMIADEDVQAVVEVLRSGIVNSSSVAHLFAGEFQRYLGAPLCVPTSTGTLALLLALRSCGVEAGDQVLVPSYVCNDVLAAVRLAGARPRLVDSSADHPNMDTADAIRKGPGARAVIAVHLFGRPIDLEPLRALGIPIIEDCSHSLGAVWQGRPPGSLGCAAAFSFHPLKMITCGEGGMAVANTEESVERLRRSQNPEYDQDGFQEHYHLSNIAAALGLSQFRRLSGNVQRRRQIFSCYRHALEDIGGLWLPRSRGEQWESSCMRFVVCHPAKTFDQLEASFLARGVTVRRPVKHLLHSYRPYRDMECSRARYYFDHALSLPMHLKLTDSDVQRVAEVAREVFRG